MNLGPPSGNLMTCELDLSQHILNKYSKPTSPNVLVEPSKSINWEQVKLTDGGSPDLHVPTIAPTLAKREHTIK